jgi:hypothetical protein
MKTKTLERHVRSPETVGTVYLLHLDPPFLHARHYIGFTTLDLDERLRRHRTERGARLLQAQTRAGGTWRIAKVWTSVQRGLELVLKRKGGAARICPICRRAPIRLDTAAHDEPGSGAA